MIVRIYQLEVTCGTADVNEPSRPDETPPNPSPKAWRKIVAVEMRFEDPCSDRDAQQNPSPDPDFPHEIDGDLAD
jgi:hypothetical protein